MDRRTLEVLEFDRIRRMLAEEASFGAGRDAALALEPSTDPAEVARTQRETSEARYLMDGGQSVPLGGLRDIRPLLESARAGDLLEPSELLDVAQTCESAGRLRRFLAGRSDRCPTLAFLAEAIGVFPNLISDIGRCISERAEVADSASKKLEQIRTQTRVTLSRVRDKLESIIRSADYRKVLQDPVITLRQERYVVPVRSEFKEQLPGVVHDRSASGVTLFVEPLNVVPLNNELRELNLQERDEVARILRELTDAVLRESEALDRTLDVLGHLDLCFAKGRLSGRLNAAPPTLSPDYTLDLVQARHPLLKVPPPGRVVPIDVRLGRDFDTMVVTGPNTGGKTVTLKTVGLLTIMAMAGLHIPATEGSVVSVFRGVWADIGDEQSIEQNLSTFSSHLRHIIGIIKCLDDCGGEGQLVLLDEIGAGTDPAEGAALAMALLEHFHGSGARTAATTHYSEIKAFVYERDRMTNASVEFDVETLAPTYKLMIGLPGKSNALEISDRLGLPQTIIDRAKSFIRQEDRHDVPALIQRLEEDRAHVSEELRDAREVSRRARETQEEQAKKWANLRADEEKVLEKAREEAREIVRTARLASTGILGRLRETESRLRAMEEGWPLPEEHPDSGELAPEAPAPLPLDSRRRLDRLEQAARDILSEAARRVQRLSSGEEDEPGDARDAGAGEPPDAGTQAAPAGAAATRAAGRRTGKAGRAAGVRPDPETVKVGRTYFIAGVKHFGEVIEAPDEGGMVGLLVGSMRLTVHLSDLRVPGKEGVPEFRGKREREVSALAAAFPDPAEAARRAGSGAALEKAMVISPEIMLRGLTVEEALGRLDKYLDDAVLAGLTQVRIIHGKGTGALRQAVKEYLDEHPDVHGHYIAQQSEGGMGATIAVLGRRHAGPASGGAGPVSGLPEGGDDDSGW